MEIQNLSEEDREILDYYSYGEEEDDGEMHKWWEMVVEAGKKVAMAGVIVSSAPAVLPPLLVVAALGFAVAVPFAVAFASYACTQKLMTKLLPNIQEEEEMKKDTGMRIGMVDDENVDGGEKNEERERDVESPTTHHRQQSTTSTSSSSENEDRENEELEREKIKKQQISMEDDAANDEHQKEKTQQPSAGAEDLGSHQGDVVASEPEKAGNDSGSGVTVGDSDKVGNGVVNGDSDKDWEDKTREKINAIRMIVGFKAPRLSSYLEEVKALYSFTGINPPSPTTSPSELDHNLSFLMSVIGVK